MIDGVTLDSDQIATYTSALVQSALPQNAGARYITDPQPLRRLEGKEGQPCNRVRRLPLGVSSACFLELSRLPERDPATPKNSR